MRQNYHHEEEKGNASIANCVSFLPIAVEKVLCSEYQTQG